MSAGFGGCGSQGELGPEATAEAFIGALRNGDAEAACETLDNRTLKDLEASGSCEEVLGKGFELFTDENVAIPDYEIGEAAVDGDAAEVTLRTDSGTAETIRLLREGDEWKLDGATALDQFHPDSPPAPEGGVQSGSG